MARWTPRTWGARHLLVAWCVYWLALLAASPIPLLQAWRLTRDPARHGAITGSIGDGAASLTIADGGATLWTGSIPWLELVLRLVGPPLLLYVAWLASRPARRRDAAASAARPALRAGDDLAAGLAPRRERDVEPARRTPDPGR